MAVFNTVQSLSYKKVHNDKLAELIWEGRGRGRGGRSPTVCVIVASSFHHSGVQCLVVALSLSVFRRARHFRAVRHSRERSSAETSPRTSELRWVSSAAARLSTRTSVSHPRLKTTPETFRRIYQLSISWRSISGCPPPPIVRPSSRSTPQCHPIRKPHRFAYRLSMARFSERVQVLTHQLESLSIF